MPVIPNVNQTPSAYAQELAKWEMVPTEATILARVQPGRPYQKGNTNGMPGANYPKMLYMARETPGSGKLTVMLPMPNSWQFKNGDEYEHARLSTINFNASCQHTVNNEDEELKYKGMGWRETDKEALALAHQDHADLALAAAERAASDRRMGEKARAEADAAEKAAEGRHLGAIPEKRVKRAYNRKPKVQPEPTAA